MASLKRKLDDKESTYCTVERNGKEYELKTKRKKKYRLYGQKWERICMTAFCISKAIRNCDFCLKHDGRAEHEKQHKFDSKEKALCSHPQCPLKVQPIAAFIDKSGKRCKLCTHCREWGLASYYRKRQHNFNLRKEMGGKCVDCGNDNILALQFDHVNWDGIRRPKVGKIEGYKKRRQEAKLTVLRCANCHCIKSYKDKYNKPDKVKSDLVDATKSRSLYKKKRKFINDIKRKMNSQCTECKWIAKDDESLCALHFQRTNGGSETICQMCTQLRSDAAILSAIENCKLVCANCRQISHIKNK